MNAGRRRHTASDAGSQRSSFDRTTPQLDVSICTNDPSLRGVPQTGKGGSPTVRLWASHYNKFDVGGCTDCALAATTAAACSAILEREHTNAKESIVDEPAEIEVEIEEIDEIEDIEEGVLLDAWRVEQLSRLGLSHIIASAVATFVDWHEIARLVEHGCSPELALEIVR
jgi:hypothetical protein